MKKIRNRKFEMALLALLMVILVGIQAFFIYQHIRKSVIVVSNWNGMEKRYVLCKVRTKDEPTTSFTDCWTIFKPVSEEELEEALKETLKENPDYLGDITFYEDVLTFENAKLYYSDNNYFVLYYVESRGESYWQLQNCCSPYNYNDSYVTIPTPVYMPIERGVVEYTANELGMNQLDTLFDHYTFEELCEFYGRFDSEYAAIDEENRKIHVTGYDKETHELISDCIIINYDDRTLDGIDENGDRIIIDGK